MWDPVSAETEVDEKSKGPSSIPDDPHLLQEILAEEFLPTDSPDASEKVAIRFCSAIFSSSLLILELIRAFFAAHDEHKWCFISGEVSNKESLKRISECPGSLCRLCQKYVDT